ncbi:hypothetical protein KO02_09445 [Sphingobacterium sp. ML3W]|uniref:right-handed parallel beta-helix repeat-containing protein n=1 Tax=Sphingobacterium sp. ML3W TaxID=1538644 RepID=UPI0004F89989|nr:right-handed parallel beta-helix repeat-containing protein [Sphingobacterium sp. ML3W]AIM36890.1 hypothetical protein KO02_09445 [Sphingobacterium sp. ML3W]
MNNQFLVKSTMAELRALTSSEISDLVNDIYDGVILLGYYERGDTPAPILYYKSSTSKVDDSGSVIVVNNFKLEHKFSDKVNVSYFGARGNGISDDTVPIQKAVNLGKDIEFLKNKNYKVTACAMGRPITATGYLVGEGGVALSSNTIVYGNNAKITAFADYNQPAYNIFRIENIENVIVKDLELIGDRNSHTGTLGEWGYGIAVLGSRNILLNNVVSKNMWGDGVNIQMLNANQAGVTQDTHCSNVTLENCIFSNNRRQGLSIEDGSTIRVSGCTFDKSNGKAPQCGIDIEPIVAGRAFVDGVTIEDCMFSDNENSGILMESLNGPISNVTIQNCFFHHKKAKISNAVYIGINTSRNNLNTKILGNTFDKSLDRSLYITGGMYMAISGNYIAKEFIVNSTDTNLPEFYTDNLVIDNNTLLSGLTLESGVRKVTISNNKIESPIRPNTSSIGIFNKSQRLIANNNEFNNCETGIHSYNTTTTSAIINENIFKNINIGVVAQLNSKIISNQFINTGINKTSGYGECISLELGCHNLYISNNHSLLDQSEATKVIQSSSFSGVTFIGFKYNNSQYNYHCFIGYNVIANFPVDLSKTNVSLLPEAISGNLSRRQILFKDEKGVIVTSSSALSPQGTKVGDFIRGSDNKVFTVITAPVFSGIGDNFTVVTQAVLRELTNTV